MLAKLKNKRGFTLVELMIVVAIIGVLAALAIYGVKKYLSSAKTAEARAGVGRLAKDACNKFNGEKMVGTTLALGGTAAPSSELCPSTTPVPSAANIALIRGRKWQSGPADWQAAGFDCLHFSMDQPQYFQYQYTETGVVTAANSTFQAIAHGNLNGDSADTLSTFSMDGVLLADSAGLICTVSPGMTETLPEE